MTLIELSTSRQEHVEPSKNCEGMMAIVFANSQPYYLLDDYVVSSVAGPVIWLIPRTKSSQLTQPPP